MFSLFGTLRRWRSPHARGLVAVAIALLVTGCIGWGRGQAADGRLTATVDYAKSGHTLELLFELSPEMPVTSLRLEGIQAPDREQAPWGEAARSCLSDRLPQTDNQIVRVESSDGPPDQYGRLWAYVWNGSTLMNQALLEEGCAYLASDRLAQSGHYATLLYAQELARLLGRGIWDPAQPLRESPETFRRRSHSP